MKTRGKNKYNAFSFLGIALTIFITSNAQTKLSVVLPKGGSTKTRIFIIDSTGSFNTIEDVLQLPQFQNKVVYIDIWATTCVPCIREFSYEKQLREKYKNKPAEFLFICYNYHDTLNDSWRKKWKDLVNKYKLAGTHVYVYVLPPNKIIHKIIDRDFLVKMGNNPISYGVPTYMTAKNGKIINYDAPRPSDKNNLYKQIDSLLFKTP